MKHFFSTTKARGIVGTFILAAALGVGMYASAVAGPVTPATGGTNVSIDTTTAGGTSAWTMLTGFVISESSVGDIAQGMHTVTLPAGWEFRTDQAVVIGGNSTDLLLGFTTITADPTSISFNVVSTSSSSPAVLTFSNVQVRPTTTTPSTGNMTMTAGTIAGADGTTNFGTLTSVPGVATKLAFTTQPAATTEYGSAITPALTVQSQDQFGNASVSGMSSNRTVTLSLTGSGAIFVGDVTEDIGTSAGNGTVTFSGIEIDDIGTGNTFTADDATLIAATSDPFDITPKAITATITADNKTYDGNTTAIISGADVASHVEYGDALGVDTTGYLATFDTADAGTGKTVSVTGLVLNNTDSAKYTLATTNTGTADITPLAVTVTADALQTKVYGESDPTFTYTESAPLISGNSFTGALSRVAGVNVGTYAITQGTLSAGGNYSITFVPDNFSITARPITIEASPNTKVYDGATTSVALPFISVGTLASGDTANFIQEYSNPDVNTGKRLTPSGTAGGNSGLNYSYIFDWKMNGIITAKELTVSGLSAADKTYDGNTTAVVNGTPALVGVVAGDTVSISGSPVGTFDSANAGSRTVQVSGLSLTGADAGNYTLTQPALTATINPLAVTVTPNGGQTKVYGQADPTFTYTNTALVGADTLTGALSRAVGTNVGTYAITLGTVTGGANYTVTLDVAPVTFSITPKPITLTVDGGQTKVYGTVDPTLTDTITTGSLESGDSLTGTLTRAVGETVGTYAISQGTRDAGTNYTITFVGDNFTITKATPIVTWANPADIVYGTLLSGTQLNAGASVPGAFVYTPAAGTQLNAGAGQTLSVDFTPTDTTNYNNATGSATINVLKATPVITWATPPAMAAGTALSGTQLNAGADVPGTFVYTPAAGYTGFTLVGTETLSADFTPTDVANYNSVNGTTVSLTIVPAPISKFLIAGSPSSVDITSASTITITGQDAYSNVVTNDSSTIALLMTDNGAALANGFLTLTSGVATTQLTKSSVGVAHVVVSSGSVTPKQASITFTDASDRTAPMILSLATDKASYEATNDTNITVTVTEDNTANTVTVNGNSATETTPGTWTVTFVKSTTVGTQSLSVSAADISGNVSIMSGSYNVVANAVAVVTPTVSLVGSAIVSAYSATEAAARFASDLQFSTTNAASVTVNGTSVTAGATITADTLAGATTLGAHTYNVIVTSSTGHTANMTVAYQVNADTVTPVLPTISLVGSAIVSSYTATDAATRFASGLQFTTADAATTTVNGTVVTSAATLTAATLGDATTLGAHTYNVVVTSSTGHTESVLVSYQVTADTVVAVTPTVSLVGSAIVSAYSATEAAARFASDLQFNTTNAASVTVNGSSVTPGATITAAALADATTLGAHTYTVVVTSSTGHTASVLVSYQVNADVVTPVTPTVTLNGTAIASAYSATDAATRFASGLQFDTTNAASVTVNGATVTPAATVTAATLVDATTLGAHTYTVVVTSSTGHTATSIVSYQVNADTVTPVTPTVSLVGSAIVSAYSATEAAARFASDLQFSTTNAASVTVNGTSVTAGATITADTLAGATTLGAHTYNVIVTSSTGHTANMTVAYQVNADVAVQGNGTLGVSGITTINSTMTADDSYTNGGSWTFFITVPMTETNLALKFGDWTSGSNTILTANNMRIYSAQSSNASSSASAIAISAANTYSTNLLLTGDLNSSVEGRQVAVTVDLKVPTTTAGGSYSTNYGVQSN